MKKFDHRIYEKISCKWAFHECMFRNNIDFEVRNLPVGKPRTRSKAPD